MRAIIKDMFLGAILFTTIIVVIGYMLQFILSLPLMDRVLYKIVEKHVAISNTAGRTGYRIYPDWVYDEWGFWYTP